MTSHLKKITVLGSGNWGSAISKVIATNVLNKGHIFDQTVRLWVFEEIFEGRRLSEIINTEHENKKYLSGIKLPSNLLAVTDLVESAIDADLLVVVIPHQFVERTCSPLKGKVKSDCVALSLIKGVNVGKDGISLFSDVISNILGVEVGVMSGANVANEVAAGHFCESTLALKNKSHAKLFLEAIGNSNLKLDVIEDVAGAQLCGALKNVVAVAAGTIDGLGYGPNTKAAVIRIGMMEMKKFIKTFFPEAKEQTMFESCGIADLVVTCFAGRNRLASESHAKTGKSFDKLEKELLGGQSLQGVSTAREVHEFLVARNITKEYPLFETVYKICYESMDPKETLRSLGHGTPTPPPKQ